MRARKRAPPAPWYRVLVVTGVVRHHAHMGLCGAPWLLQVSACATSALRVSSEYKPTFQDFFSFLNFKKYMKNQK